jgi:heme-degrading monooxygenase HmoA
MWVRVTTLEGEAGADQSRVSEMAEMVRSKVLPAAEAMDGFRGMLTVAEAESGRSMSLTFWESEDAMRASEEAANRLRKDFSEESGDAIADVRRYEVLIDERR